MRKMPQRPRERKKPQERNNGLRHRYHGYESNNWNTNNKNANDSNIQENAKNGSDDTYEP